jgi:hypothetical protein
VATSAIRVENLFRKLNGSSCGRDDMGPRGTPGIHNDDVLPARVALHTHRRHCVAGFEAGFIRGVDLSLLLVDEEILSATIELPRTLLCARSILASTAVRWAAVRTNPEFRYTPAPGCSSFRIITAVAIQGPPLPSRSAPMETIGAKSVTARQSANAKRTLPSWQTNDASLRTV